MYEWHKQMIENLKHHFETDFRFLALVIVGSVARDDAREDSDLDFVLVARENSVQW